MKADTSLVNKPSVCPVEIQYLLTGETKGKDKEGRRVGLMQEGREERKGKGSRGKKRRKYENKSLSSLTQCP